MRKKIYRPEMRQNSHLEQVIDKATILASVKNGTVPKKKDAIFTILLDYLRMNGEDVSKFTSKN